MSKTNSSSTNELLKNKPDTIRPNPLKEWIRVKLLYKYLKNLPKNEKTLDIGCGWGVSFKINPNFYGIEYDLPCYEALKDKYNVKRANILEPLPYENNFFDNCFTQDVLEHFSLDNMEILFRNVHKILKPNGRFINVIPNKKGFEYGIQIGAGHIHHLSTNDMKILAEKTGFRLEKYYSYPLPEALSEIYTHNKWVYTLRKNG